ARVLGVVGHLVGLAVRGHDPHLAADAALAQLLLGRLHRLQIALRAHHDPDQRSIDLELVELSRGFAERLGLAGNAFAHPDTPAAMSRRSCLPENSIMSAAAYAPAR